jgi:microcystin-dependent protein
LDFTPVGSIISFAAPIVPEGFLECNGQIVLKTDYPKLFETIGSTYGSDVESFQVPDLRGQFLRGWNHDGGVDPEAGSRSTGNRVGSKQGFDTNKTNLSVTPGGAHKHTIQDRYSGENSYFYHSN